jgi:hypothetical protein
MYQCGSTVRILSIYAMIFQHFLIHRSVCIAVHQTHTSQRIEGDQWLFRCCHFN